MNPRCTPGVSLANLSFALNRVRGGVGVGGYHAGNLVLHLGSALLLFGIVRRTWRTGGTWLACCVALLWTVHPLTTAAVTYVSQRTELLMATCYLLTLYAFIRACETRRTGWWIAAVSACALGVMSKEAMITAPVLVLLYLKLAVWPSPLVFDYGAVYGGSIAAAGVLAGLLVVTIAAWRRNPAQGFAGAFFFVLLAPTSSVVPVAEQPIAENRMYLPLALVVSGAVIAGRTLAREDGPEGVAVLRVCIECIKLGNHRP